MIARVAARGGSFKGAGMYYLHDKREEGEAVRTTSERVAWTHTQNLPTNDPEKAMKWMAYTSMNSDTLKEQSGTSKCGRKATAGSVYSFSLAWHPDQKPQKEEMMTASQSTLERLGLSEHQAVFVAHQETGHKHVHIICNLVHPQTGKTARVSHDRITLSDWAEKYEREHGKIYCEQRVENNEKRRQLAQDEVKAQRQEEQQKHRVGERRSKPDSGIVKHREKKMERASMIQDLYAQSDNGKSFSAALQEQGYTLAKGDRRGFVVVDQDGEIHSLSRQLKGQRAADLRARLSDVDDLREATIVADELRYFDRDTHEAEQQKAIVDGAIEAEKKVRSDEQITTSVDKKEKVKAKDNKKSKLHSLGKDDPIVLAKRQSQVWDDRIAYDNDAQDERLRLKKKYHDFYKRDETTQKIKDIKKRLEEKGTLRGRLSGRRKALEEELQNLEQDLKQTDDLTAQQMGRFEKETKENRPEVEAYTEPGAPSLDAVRPKIDNEAIERMKERKQNLRGRGRNEGPKI